VVHRTLKTRSIQAIYGDMSQRDTLHHAGIGRAQVILSTLPDAILKGTSNARLVRESRELNPSALIVATAENFPQVSELYAAGADFVSIGRLAEANALCQVLEAAESGLLEEKRAELDALLENRNEVLS